MSLHIQNRLPVQSTQLEGNKKADEKKGIGSFMDLMVSLGKGLGKVVKFFKNIFPEGGISLGNRKAEVGQTRPQQRVNNSPLEQVRANALMNATVDEIEQGYLNADRVSFENKNPGKEFKPDAQKFRQDWGKAVCDDKGCLRPELHQGAKQMFKEMLRNAVGNNPNPGTILRSNSPATLLQGYYFRAVGQQYITNMLKPTVDVARVFSGDNPFEVRPEMLNGTPQEVEKQISQNAERLKGLYQDLLDRVCDSSEEVPQEMCNWCKEIYNTIIEKGGSHETARSGASAAIILRVLNPILTSPGQAPQQNSLCDGPLSPGVTRGLMNLSKVLQNQANNILEFDKDKTLKPLESLLTSNSPKFDNFLDEVIERGVL